jgi:hypothetical protein
VRSPREVFDDPRQHWNNLIAPADEDFEGQHFDRKEASRIDEHGSVAKNQFGRLVDQIEECVSAFANANRDGGLLVAGISRFGEIKGINHLNDNQRKAITDLACVLTRRGFARGFTTSQNPSRSRDSPPQVAVLMAG